MRLNYVNIHRIPGIYQHAGNRGFKFAGPRFDSSTDERDRVEKIVRAVKTEIRPLPGAPDNWFTRFLRRISG